jgi:hypothetical protein
MTKHGSIRLIMISACIAALVAQIALTSAAKATGNAPALGAAAAEDASEKISIRPVLVVMSTTVVPAAGSQLIRTRDGVFMTLSTKNLTPGWVYTAWWGIFNNPSNCATRPCSAADFGPTNPVQGSRVNAGGRIIGPDGSAIYSAFLGLGDTTGAFDGPGLLNPKHAEIHLVVRSHGPALM